MRTIVCLSVIAHRYEQYVAKYVDTKESLFAKINHPGGVHV